MSARRKLRDFYKLDPNDPESTGEKEQNNEDKDDSVAEDVDLPDTLPAEYTENLLSNATLAELISTEDAIAQEKAALESSQRELVNNNYKKLIQAAKSLEYLNGQGALTGLEALAASVQAISDQSRDLWTSENGRAQDELSS